MDVLWCVNQISTSVFSLDDMYRFERVLSEKHPDNHNVKAKIRQQLQLLRDRDILAFLKPGIYQKQ